jgi:hypothetical protein
MSASEQVCLWVPPLLSPAFPESSLLLQERLSTLYLLLRSLYHTRYTSTELSWEGETFHFGALLVDFSSNRPLPTVPMSTLDKEWARWGDRKIGNPAMVSRTSHTKWSLCNTNCSKCREESCQVVCLRTKFGWSSLGTQKPLENMPLNAQFWDINHIEQENALGKRGCSRRGQ